MEAQCMHVQQQNLEVHLHDNCHSHSLQSLIYYSQNSSMQMTLPFDVDDVT